MNSNYPHIIGVTFYFKNILNNLFKHQACVNGLAQK